MHKEMKNEFGIEVKCDNCLDSQKFCRDNEAKCSSFIASVEAYKQRIKELQEQQFSEEELQFIKNRLDECIEAWDSLEMVFTAHQILKKIERLNNE
jgi:primosomal protein N''